MLAISLSLLSVLKVYSQKQSNFEGVIKYAISFDGAKLPPEAMAILKDAETVIYLKGDKRRVDMIMPMQSTSTIVDNKNNNSVTLMEFMGHKFLIKMNGADIKKEQDSAPEINVKFTDETKVIAGYKCKKAIVTIKKNTENVMNVFYTDEISNNDIKPIYKGIKGLLMEYSMNQGGREMKFTAKSISKESVAESKFEIPKEGYTETTIEELPKIMMKQMGGQK